MDITEINVNDEETSDELVTAGNGNGAVNRSPDAAECDGLLAVQISGANGEAGPSGNAAESHNNIENNCAPQEMSSVCRIKKELNENVYKGVKLWMIIVIIFLLIPVVIIVSLLVCSAIHEDVDEKFDPSLFKVPQYFKGSFQMPNLVFTEELFTLSSNESQALAAHLQNELSDIYSSSPALGRYFFKAETYAFRNGSVIADFKLTFHLPEEQQDQLRNFTLSKEMVYNVFRQFIYDQQPAESGTKYIDPVSIKFV
ncbi:TPA-induced transmembrane protein isoform X1 [Embiotoca jacksoni]|uniref:TPA-induced transmembrane protein isoform X1 n=1 Tax=Embiotoca jacksoni TaxID=100190 RepID=UPI003704AD53